MVVLDLGLPDIDGINVLQQLRGFSRSPVLVISARHDPAVITNALNLGAKDYILKPFKFETFLSSLREVSDPSRPIHGMDVPARITDELTICCQTRDAILKGRKVELTESEWRILNTLIEHRGGIVPVKILTEIISPDGSTSDASVHLLVDMLRKKLGDDPYVPRLIISEFECGYRFARYRSSERLFSG